MVIHWAFYRLFLGGGGGSLVWDSSGLEKVFVFGVEFFCGENFF